MMVQVGLESDHKTMTTWIEKYPRLKENDMIKLKGFAIWWTVVKVYEGVELDKSQVESNRKWDNNNYDKHDGRAMKNR